MTVTHPETRWDDGVVYFGDAILVVKSDARGHTAIVECLL